jgi:hypothetical protein
MSITVNHSNHRYSIDIPDNMYKQLKVKSAIEGKTMRELVLIGIKSVISKNDEESVNESLKLLSTKTFDEWNSKEDDEAFKHLENFVK